ncbi:hypothetical protein BDM02DRAFT_3155738 [Thelephora ganbajun]|uniref:Uncharacterized protein n=1 Tax=Thelephora ganbajun TaxID=370292 RepID=A0ACB6ZH28_THEGA|nr:hypothetical protein BDM02DRAFT_3155738 [Thelephora ganbajun]
MSCLFRFSILLFLLSSVFPSYAIKFNLPAYRWPQKKCLWNPAHDNTLVIVTANISPGPGQRTDIEIVDSSPQRNVYLRKKGIKAETRLAVTTHSEGEVGVCTPDYETKNKFRTIDLDVDIGADAVDYNAIANQESLSGLETEMRRLEGLVKEIVDEMGYLKKREERFAGTNISTNKRVQKFAWFTLAALVGLGIWQILHLRAFFKRKYLID